MRKSLMGHITALAALGLAGCSEAPGAPSQPARPASDPAAPATMLAAPAGARAVMVRADGGLDSCALGMIDDPPSGPEQGAVMVFGAATTDLDMIDTLMHEDQVWVCEESGDMVGIVYPSDDTMDCGLSSPPETSAPYRGPCQTGWVKQQWVRIIAG